MTDNQPEEKTWITGTYLRWIPWVLLALVTVSAGVYFSSNLWHSYTDRDSIHRPVNDSAPRDVLWKKPSRFGNRINNGKHTYAPAITGNESLMVFVRGKPSRNADLFISRRTDDGWSKPEPLEQLNTPTDELGPTIGPDRRRLFFYSDRDGGHGGYDVWMARWNGDTWSDPVNAGSNVNTIYNEYDPFLTPGGRLLFSSNRPDRKGNRNDRPPWTATLRHEGGKGDYDIYAAEKGSPVEDNNGEGSEKKPASKPVSKISFKPAERLDTLNSSAYDGQPALSPAGDFLYFSSSRKGGQGGFDLYRSRLVNDRFRSPRNLGPPLNGPYDEMDPALMAHGFQLIFSSNRRTPGEKVSGKKSGKGTDGVRKQPFELYRSISREVTAVSDGPPLSSLWTLLDDLKWSLLLLLLAALALATLLGAMLKHDRSWELSMLQRCLFLSALLHVLLAFLFSMWVVTSTIYKKATEEPMTVRVDSENLAEEKLSMEIREEVTDLSSSDEQFQTTETPSRQVTKLDVEPIPENNRRTSESTFKLPKKKTEMNRPEVESPPTSEKTSDTDVRMKKLEKNVANAEMKRPENNPEPRKDPAGPEVSDQVPKKEQPEMEEVPFDRPLKSTSAEPEPATSSNRLAKAATELAPSTPDTGTSEPEVDQPDVRIEEQRSTPRTQTAQTLESRSPSGRQSSEPNVQPERTDRTVARKADAGKLSGNPSARTSSSETAQPAAVQPDRTAVSTSDIPESSRSVDRRKTAAGEVSKQVPSFQTSQKLTRADTELSRRKTNPDTERVQPDPNNTDRPLRDRPTQVRENTSGKPVTSESTAPSSQQLAKTATEITPSSTGTGTSEPKLDQPNVRIEGKRSTPRTRTAQSLESRSPSGRQSSEPDVRPERTDRTVARKTDTGKLSGTPSTQVSSSKSAQPAAVQPNRTAASVSGTPESNRSDGRRNPATDELSKNVPSLNRTKELARAGTKLDNRETNPETDLVQPDSSDVDRPLRNGPAQDRPNTSDKPIASESPAPSSQKLAKSAPEIAPSTPETGTSQPEVDQSNVRLETERNAPSLARTSESLKTRTASGQQTSGADVQPERSDGTVARKTDAGELSGTPSTQASSSKSAQPTTVQSDRTAASASDVPESSRSDGRRNPATGKLNKNVPSLKKTKELVQTGPKLDRRETNPETERVQPDPNNTDRPLRDKPALVRGNTSDNPIASGSSDARRGRGPSEIQPTSGAGTASAATGSPPSGEHEAASARVRVNGDLRSLKQRAAANQALETPGISPGGGSSEENVRPAQTDGTVARRSSEPGSSGEPAQSVALTRTNDAAPGSDTRSAATPEGLVAQTRPSKKGGVPAGNVSEQVPALNMEENVRMKNEKPINPYEIRDPERHRDVVSRLGGDEKTEKAVRRALDWLKRHQKDDGRWDIEQFGGRKKHDIAATGLAALCFYGWGASHQEDGPYRDTTRKAINWLKKKAKKEGDLAPDDKYAMYDQGIGTLALAEAYAITGDPSLKEPTQRAIDFIVKAQNPKHGGWRYRPGSNNGDTSVFGWQVMALRSAKFGGLDVPEHVFEKSRKWLDRVGKGKHNAIYGYQKNKHGRPAMVAEGFFSQHLLGLSPDNPRMKASARHLEKRLPGNGDGSYYYWYYGSMALYQQQGPVWRKWNRKMKKKLLAKQKRKGDKKGTWDPDGRWGGRSGRVVTTAFATLTLEVYYRMLPLQTSIHSE